MDRGAWGVAVYEVPELDTTEHAWMQLFILPFDSSIYWPPITYKALCWEMRRQQWEFIHDAHLPIERYTKIKWSDCIKCYRGNKVVWQDNWKRLTSVLLSFCSQLIPKDKLVRQSAWGPQKQGEEKRQTTASEDDQRSGKEKPQFHKCGNWLSDWTRSQAGTERTSVISEDGWYSV